MHKGKGAAPRKVRVRIAFFGRAMSGPAGMPYAAGGKHAGFGRKFCFQGGQSAGGSDHMELSRLHEGHAGRVIPTVFQPVQPFNQKRNRRPMSAVTNDSTHIQKTSCQSSLS